MNTEHPQIQPIDVVAAVIAQDECMLICKRGAERNNAGLWEFPGGRVENGEDHRQALKRELKECFGVDVDIGPYVTTSRHRYSDRVVALHAYQVSCESHRTWLPRTEHVAVAWVRQSDLQEFKFAPADELIAQRLCSEGEGDEHFFDVEATDKETATPEG